MKRATHFNASAVARRSTQYKGEVIQPPERPRARAHAPRRGRRVSSGAQGADHLRDQPAARDAEQRQGRHPPAHLRAPPGRARRRPGARARRVAPARIGAGREPGAGAESTGLTPGLGAQADSQADARRRQPRRSRRSDATQAAPPASSAGAQAAQIALGEQGTPYVCGGSSPCGFDCSGLVMWAYGQLGISLPHYTGSLWNSGTHVSQDQLEPGDLVFFHGESHVGIYIGGGAVRARAAHRRRREGVEPQRVLVLERLRRRRPHRLIDQRFPDRNR